MAAIVKDVGKRAVDHATQDLRREADLRTAKVREQVEAKGKVIAGAFEQAKEALSPDHLQSEVGDLTDDVAGVVRDQPWLAAMIASGIGLVIGALVLIGQERQRRRMQWRNKARRMAREARERAESELGHVQERAEELGGRVTEVVEDNSRVLGVAALALALLGIASRFVGRQE